MTKLLRVLLAIGAAVLFCIAAMPIAFCVIAVAICAQVGYAVYDFGD